MSSPTAVLPDVELRTLQGDTIVLRDPTVPARLLVVYRNDCPACALVLPVIERVSRSFHGKKLLTLGISQDDEDGTLDAINEHGLCFPQAVDAALAVSRALAIVVVPTVLLAGADGQIVARCDGVARDALTELLLAAARLSGADAAHVARTVEGFALPVHLPGTPVARD